MDDESGWNQVLVEGWGDHVRAAVCERVEDVMIRAKGVLAVAVVDPDDATADAVERVHRIVVRAIAEETGADLDLLGSQAAWATYDDVWAELGRRWSDGGGMEALTHEAAAEVTALLARLPTRAVESAGGVLDDRSVRLVHVDGVPHLDVEGVFHWLATDDDAGEATRDRARAVVAAARHQP